MGRYGSLINIKPSDSNQVENSVIFDDQTEEKVHKKRLQLYLGYSDKKSNSNSTDFL